MKLWTKVIISVLPTLISRLMDRFLPSKKEDPVDELVKASTRNEIRLIRYEASEDGVFGVLQLGKYSCFTVERPWENNAPSISCIPAGTYALRKRPSPIVERTTRGEYKEGWEVCNVPGRTHIMIHVANTIDDLEGCIGVGDDIGNINGRKAVINSLSAFRQVMEHLTEDEYTIIIREDLP